jgi:hypothetical protein
MKLSTWAVKTDILKIKKNKNSRKKTLTIKVVTMKEIYVEAIKGYNVIKKEEG